MAAGADAPGLVKYQACCGWGGFAGDVSDASGPGSSSAINFN